MARNQNERLNALPTLEEKGQAYNTKQADNRAANPGPSAEPTLKTSASSTGLRLLMIRYG
jgi:hypothetical protein